MPTKMRKPRISDPVVSFFWSHGGWSYNPSTQTQAEGRMETAKSMAAAERAGSDAGLSFEWDLDPDVNSSDFEDSGDPWKLWFCLCRNIEGEVLASLGGIDFGRDGDPWSSPYRRVVEAELASEALE